MKAKQSEQNIDASAAKRALVPAFACARVSSKEQERQGYSIPVQLKRVHEYAERHGFVIVAEYVDVETATEPGRHEFSRMVEAARHDASIGAIICEKVDRLCRNLRDYLTIDELPAKTLFWQQDFPDNAAGKLSLGMMCSWLGTTSTTFPTRSRRAWPGPGRRLSAPAAARLSQRPRRRSPGHRSGSRQGADGPSRL